MECVFERSITSIMSNELVLRCLGCGYGIRADAMFCDECGLARTAVDSTTGRDLTKPAAINPSTVSDLVEKGSQLQIAVKRRYREGYLYAIFINGAGGFLMVVGTSFVVITFLVSVGLGGNLEGSAAQGMIGPPKGAGILVGSLIYLLGTPFGIVSISLGIIMRAVAQAMTATFDTAVYASPFINDGDRATIMSLPND